MDAITKAAVITWLLEHKIKLVHVWPMGEGWTAMVETPPCGSRNGQPTFPDGQKVGCGSDPTAVGSVIKALDAVGAASIEFRMHLLEFMVNHLANRSVPAILRRLEGGGKN